MLKIAAITLVVYSTVALCALWYYETPTIGCGQIRTVGPDGVSASGAYYCHIILKPR
jgi:hypothetical protein